MMTAIKCPRCRRKVLVIPGPKGELLYDPDPVRCVWDANRGSGRYTFGEHEAVFPGCEPREDETEAVYTAYREHKCRRRK